MVPSLSVSSCVMLVWLFTGFESLPFVLGFDVLVLLQDPNSRALKSLLSSIRRGSSVFFYLNFFPVFFSLIPSVVILPLILSPFLFSFKYYSVCFSLDIYSDPFSPIFFALGLVFPLVPLGIIYGSFPSLFYSLIFF